MISPLMDSGLGLPYERHMCGMENSQQSWWRSRKASDGVAESPAEGRDAWTLVEFSLCAGPFTLSHLILRIIR